MSTIVVFAIVRSEKGGIVEWIQFAIFFIGVFGLFIWNRAEARSDARHADAQLRANRDLIFEIRKENYEVIQGWRKETAEVIQDWRKETAEMMRDFHGRLCAIEERNRK